MFENFITYIFESLAYLASLRSGKMRNLSVYMQQMITY